MDHNKIIRNLANHIDIFSMLFHDKDEREYLWKPNKNKWCLLEVACHLYDEEREDFRARVQCTLETPGYEPPPIDPVGWVIARKYMEQDYHEMVKKFLEERQKSIDWLCSLKNPSWQNSYDHQQLGPLSAAHFLTNWLAHDLFHFRQIVRLQYHYLKHISGNELSYAGNW